VNEFLKKLNEFIKTPVGIILVCLIALIILYFLISPYQICMRNIEVLGSKVFRCQKITNW